MPQRIRYKAAIVGALAVVTDRFAAIPGEKRILKNNELFFFLKA